MTRFLLSQRSSFRHRTARPAVLLVLLLLPIYLTTVAQDLPQEELTDQDISIAVESELLLSGAVQSHLIDVETEKGVVTLTGSVNSLQAKYRAARIAESIKGVRSVVNMIDVKPSDVTDRELRQDIKDALLWDPATESFAITIEVTNGDVVLEGTVNSWQEKELAARVARGVRGVRSIENNTLVRYDEERSDIDIRNDIEGRLDADVWVDGGMLDVSVDNANVELSGVVGSAKELRLARADAWVNGVKSVDAQDVSIRWWAEDTMKKDRKFASEITDEEIVDAVNLALQYDPRVITDNVTVSSRAGVVTLTGKVSNSKAKQAAGADAENTRGVWMVKNFLRIRPDVVPADDTLIERVQQALRRDPYVELFEISVSADNGLVYLDGEVNTSFEKEHAEDVASRVKGVVDIMNLLDYDYEWEYSPDWQIRQQISTELFWNPALDASSITVTVDEGVAELIGSVATWQEHAAATTEAYEGGAKDVVNNIEVLYGTLEGTALGQ